MPNASVRELLSLSLKPLLRSRKAPAQRRPCHNGSLFMCMHCVLYLHLWDTWKGCGFQHGSLGPAGDIVHGDITRGDITHDEMQQYLYSAGKHFSSTLLTARGKVLRVLKDALNKFLPANAHQLASGKLHIILTHLRDWNSLMVSEFASKEDIIQVCEQLYHDGYQDAVFFLHRLNAFGIKYLPEDFMLLLHKESCQKGEGTPAQEARNRSTLLQSNRLSGHHHGEHSICVADELEEEDMLHLLQPSER